MRSLKLPSTPTESKIESRDKFFLDMVIMTNELPGELYRMVYISQETQVSASRKAGALIKSIEGKAYIEKRKKQLEEHYFPEDVAQVTGVKVKPKTIEEAIADLTPVFIDEFSAIMKNRNDPNFADTMKVFLAKSLKDIQMDKTASPPMRYLPESCNAPCRYKAFVEKECEDECTRCKYREFGEANGLHYDHKTQLK